MNCFITLIVSFSLILTVGCFDNKDEEEKDSSDPKKKVCHNLVATGACFPGKPDLGKLNPDEKEEAMALFITYIQSLNVVDSFISNNKKKQFLAVNPEQEMKKALLTSCEIREVEQELEAGYQLKLQFISKNKHTCPITVVQESLTNSKRNGMKVSGAAQSNLLFNVNDTVYKTWNNTHAYDLRGGGPINFTMNDDFSLSTLNSEATLMGKINIAVYPNAASYFYSKVNATFVNGNPETSKVIVSLGIKAGQWYELKIMGNTIDGETLRDVYLNNELIASSATEHLSNSILFLLDISNANTEQIKTQIVEQHF